MTCEPGMVSANSRVLRTYLQTFCVVDNMLLLMCVVVVGLTWKGLIDIYRLEVGRTKHTHTHDTSLLNYSPCCIPSRHLHQLLRLDPS